MMFGTAALPHILMRYYTTPSVRQARQSVFWSLFFIFLLYFTAPSLAVLAKYDVYHFLVGSTFADLPAWAATGRRSIHRCCRLPTSTRTASCSSQIVLGTDIIVLATPEIAGLPYVVSGLVAGGLAAALDRRRLLLTIANALLARSLLQDDRSECLDEPPRIGVQSPAGGRGIDAAYVTSLKPGRHPVPGRRGVLAGGLGLLPGPGARGLLARANKWVPSSA
jgi:cation/acetate symporter